MRLVILKTTSAPASRPTASTHHAARGTLRRSTAARPATTVAALMPRRAGTSTVPPAINAPAASAPSAHPAVNVPAEPKAVRPSSAATPSPTAPPTTATRPASTAARDNSCPAEAPRVRSKVCSLRRRSAPAPATAAVSPPASAAPGTPRNRNSICAYRASDRAASSTAPRLSPTTPVPASRRSVWWALSSAAGSSFVVTFLDHFLAVWILLAMGAGLGLGRLAPGLGAALAKVTVTGVSLPITLGLLVMMYPVLAKVRYDRLDNVTRDRRLLIPSLVINWILGPAVMFALAWIFLPDLPEYRTGLIIVGLARCIAMVIIWNDLACGDREAAAVLVALNSVFQVLAFSLLGWFYLSVLPGWLGLQQTGLNISVWEIARSVLIFLGIPLAAGFLTRRLGEKTKGRTCAAGLPRRRQGLDHGVQRLRRRRELAQEGIRQFRDEEQVGGHEDAHSPDHPVVDQGMLGAEDDGEPEDQSTGQKDRHPQGRGRAEVGARLEQPFRAGAAQFPQRRQRTGEKGALGVIAGSDGPVGAVQAVQRPLGLRRGTAGRGAVPLGVRRASVRQQALPDPCTLFLAEHVEAPGHLHRHGTLGPRRLIRRVHLAPERQDDEADEEPVDDRDNGKQKGCDLVLLTPHKAGETVPHHRLDGCRPAGDTYDEPYQQQPGRDVDHDPTGHGH